MSKPKTIDELFEKVWKKHWDAPRYHESGHAREVRRNYENRIRSEFGHKRVSKVKRNDIRKWHERMGERPVSANRCLEVLSGMYKHAIDCEWFEGINPCVSIRAYTERKRKRYANEIEIRKLGDILTRSQRAYPLEVAFIYTLLFTGARPRSIERAKWADFKEGVLTFSGKSTHETGEKESVLFPKNILDILNSLPKREDGLIFGISLPSYLWRKWRKEAGCEDLWARDLRRTFATIGMSNGVDMPVVSELLNHHSVQTTKLYAKLNDTRRNQAVDTIADKLTDILGGQHAILAR